MALAVISYGLAKLDDAQFTVLESVRDQPLGEVPGFWLVWYFFGYSSFYGNFIAAVQVGAGVLLLFPQTTLLGACVLLSMMVNIGLVDIFFEVDLSGTVAAVVVTAALGFLVWEHRAGLVRLFWNEQGRRQARAPDRARRAAIAGLWIAIVLVPMVFAWWVATFNNRVPTSLDGVWEVVPPEPDGRPAAVPGVTLPEVAEESLGRKPQKELPILAASEAGIEEGGTPV